MIEQCKQCKNKETLYDGIVGCPFMDADCKKGEKFEPQTNADRIRAMSDEELANWLGLTIADTVWDELGKRGVSFSRKAGLDACNQLLEWLKQPAKECE